MGENQKEAKVNKSALDELLCTLPEEAQYAIYHGLISAGGFATMVRPMTSTELECGKTIAALLHKKYNYGHGA